MNLLLTFCVWALGGGQFLCYWTSDSKMSLIQCCSELKGDFCPNKA